MQELAVGSLRAEPRRRLLRIAQQVKQTGEATIRARPELKPGSRLMRVWEGCTYDVLVLDDGFSWQNTRYRSLSAIARKITGTAWSGPLFFGLKPNRPATRRSSQVPGPAGAPVEISNDAMTMAGSGGNLERPAAQRLVADIRAGRIDIVVVYKV